MRKSLVIIPMLFLLVTLAKAEDKRWEQATPPKETKQKTDQLNAETQVLPPLQEEQQQTMLKVLKKPPIPIKAPDKIIRVLFLPYVDKNNILNNYRYSFLKVEEGNWVLGDYLLEPARLDNKVFHPLDNPGLGLQQQQQQPPPKQKQQMKSQTPNELKQPLGDMKQYQQGSK